MSGCPLGVTLFAICKKKVVQCGGSMMQELINCQLKTPGGTQIWFGRGCAARALKPIPISKVLSSEIGTHF